MNEKQTGNYTIEETNKYPINTGYNPKKDGNHTYYRPEPESCLWVVPGFAQNLYFFFNLSRHIFFTIPSPKKNQYMRLFAVIIEGVVFENG
jgi:hypothetical protein